MPFTHLVAGIVFAAGDTVDKPTGFFGALATGAEWFIGLFNEGGGVFKSLVIGIVPTLIVLLTAVNALIRMIGPEKIDKLQASSGTQCATSCCPCSRCSS